MDLPKTTNEEFCREKLKHHDSGTDIKSTFKKSQCQEAAEDRLYMLPVFRTF